MGASTPPDANAGAPNQERGEWPDIMRMKPVATLPEKTQQGLELVRQHTAVAGEIAAMHWGKQMTPQMRRAVSSYCERWGVDAQTELDVLGGSFYINSEFYLRKLGELRRKGIIADFWFEHIHDDPRLKAMMNDTSFPQTIRDEASRRWSDAFFKRTEQNAPHDAEAICICYITLPSGGHPIKGCKWAGNGTSVKQPRSGGGSSANPIAESNAALSVESMAARRAARQIISHVGGDLPNFDAMESELEALSVAHTTDIQTIEARNAAIAAEMGAPRAIAGSGMEPYAVAAKDGEPVMIFSREGERVLSREDMSKLAHTATDPYTEAPIMAPAPVDTRRVEAPTQPAAPAVQADAFDEAVRKPAAAPAVAAAPPGTKVCLECGADVVIGDPSTHKPTCSHFAD